MTVAGIDTGILPSVRRQQPKRYTGTACPNCGLQQWKCRSGITCDNGDGYGDPSDIPFAATQSHQEQTLDEALADMPTERPSPRKGQAKGSTSHPPDSLSLGEMGRIVERVFKFDFDRSYSEVMAFLQPGDDRRLDLGFLQRELNRSAEMATLAHRLFTNAREACEIFEIDKGMIVASMREDARHKLDEDKRNGVRLKPVTDADVASMMQMQDPAKWRHLRIQTVRMEATRDHLERIADLARKRIDILKTLVEKR